MTKSSCRSTGLRLRGRLAVGLVALTLGVLGPSLVPAGAATVSGEPDPKPLTMGDPVQFQNPAFTTAAADAGAPWSIGWNPAKKAPEQLPPFQGRVEALFRQGDYVYIGGTFHRALGPDGLYDESVRHLVRVRWDTGRLDTSWKPDLDGKVANFTAFDPGDGVVRLVVVGDFTRIGANTANGRYVAAFRLNDPDPPLLDTTLFSTADVDFDQRVHAVAPEFDGTQPVLYLGGYFASVGTAGGSRVRSHLAKLRLAGDHFVLDEQWAPSLQSTQGQDVAHEWVSRIVAVPGHDRVIIGGFWTTINHRSPTQEKYLAAVDKRTGALAPWATPMNKTPAGSLKWSTTKSTSQLPLFDMVLVEEGGTPVLYTGHGGTNLAAKWNAVTGQRLWYWWSDGGVQAVTHMNGRVYFGFHGTHISPAAGGLKKGSTTVRRDGLWAVSTDGRALSSFAPSIRGESRMTEGALKVWALLGSGHLYAGGDFALVGTAKVAKFAVFPVA